jgi:hypothetical protein
MQVLQIAGLPWHLMLGRSSPRLLAIARQHLFERFEVFGFLERIREFQRRFALVNDLQFTPVFEQSKITKDRPRVADLSASTLRGMRDVQSLDIQLYEEAWSRFGHVTPA